MTIIQFASSKHAEVTQEVAPQVTNATIFQFPAKPLKPAAGHGDISDRMRAWLARRDHLKRFGKRLRVVRTILGLSIDAAGAAAGIKPQAFKNYESGATEMRTMRLAAFVKHPTVTLCGFLLTWLVEDGAPADKERDIIAYWHSFGAPNNDSHAIAGAINALDADSRLEQWRNR